MKISIIGTGRLGGALAIALTRENFEIENLVARNFQRAENIVKILESKPQILSADDLAKITSDVILIATQDSEIESVANQLSEKLITKPYVFHLSGAFASNILKRLKAVGCQTGSIHPLVSISDAQIGASRFANAYFCIEGDCEAVQTAEVLIEKLGGKSFYIETAYKTLYHASAVTACGHLIALIDVAIEMLTKCGLDEKTAQQTLLPLIKSTVENLERQTTAESLTGTFARADIETLHRHLEILREKASPEAFEIYLQLGARSLGLAEKQGASQENLEKMRRQILLAKTNLR